MSPVEDAHGFFYDAAYIRNDDVVARVDYGHECFYIRAVNQHEALKVLHAWSVEYKPWIEAITVERTQRGEEHPFRMNVYYCRNTR